jgi:hypothetical protein
LLASRQPKRRGGGGVERRVERRGGKQEGAAEGGGSDQRPSYSKRETEVGANLQKRGTGRFLPVVEEVWAVRPAGRHLLFFLLDWLFFFL